MVKFVVGSAGVELTGMSSRGVGAAETVSPLASKLDVTPEAGDPLDRAAQAILGLVHRTANDVKAKNQQNSRDDSSIVRSTAGRRRPNTGS